MSFRGIYVDPLHSKCVEPVKRNKDGTRWISHRFPIKGGISMRDTMVLDFSEPNPLFELLSDGHVGSVEITDC